MSKISVHIKCSNDKKYTVDIESSSTVLELKQKISTQDQTPVERQRLIYAGRVLKDNETLSSYKVENGHTIHMVRANVAPASSNSKRDAPSAAPPPSTVTPQQTTPPSGTSLPNPSFTSPFNQANTQSNPLLDMDPSVLDSILQNPMYQHYMSNLMQNPQLIEQLVSSNPQMSAMLTPEMRSMMANPEFLRLMSDPNVIRSMASLQSTMRGFAPSSSPNNPNVSSDQRNTSESFQAPPAANPFLGLFNNLPASTGPSPASNPANPLGMDPTSAQSMLQHLFSGQPQSNTRPEERYQIQLQQLNDMGFWDAEKNIQALTMTGGNVNAAVEWLLNHQ